MCLAVWDLVVTFCVALYSYLHFYLFFTQSNQYNRDDAPPRPPLPPSHNNSNHNQINVNPNLYSIQNEHNENIDMYSNQNVSVSVSPLNNNSHEGNIPPRPPLPPHRNGISSFNAYFIRLCITND